MAALSQTTAIWSVNNLSKYIKRFARDLTCWSIGPQIQTAKSVLFYTMYTRPQQVHIPVINWLVVSNWSSTSSQTFTIYRISTPPLFSCSGHEERYITLTEFPRDTVFFHDLIVSTTGGSTGSTVHCAADSLLFFPFLFFFRSWLAVFMLLP